MYRVLDSALTIAIAIIVGVLGAFDVIDPEVTGGATLATLGLLAVSSLRGRSALSAMDRSVAELGRDLGDRAGHARVLEPSGCGSEVDLSAAKDVRLLGVTLGRTIRNTYGVLLGRLNAGATVRILLIAPEPETLAEAARRSSMADNVAVFDHRLRSSLDMLRQLRARSGPGSLEVRLLNFVPAFGMLAQDVEARHGLMRVDIYSHRCESLEPVLALRADRDAGIVRHFIDEFDRLWSVGRPAEEVRPVDEAGLMSS
ncbi:DUF5919 domain-containing protein [Actinoplanes sp. NEAU-A12]|uniref:DUF5919 domain-containing protein n=1 Tax=Actinoplanes sandaracinus TaxID=3045177 RepID=A0ABT6WXC8_9ACTN|nr:DUF5919 domain-containing protein [Actinoplanes sandaracinus]MDI6104392.1 DUF5919 domain-containing protein [Actinoplanes sandaracinus]